MGYLGREEGDGVRAGAGEIVRRRQIHQSRNRRAALQEDVIFGYRIAPHRQQTFVRQSFAITRHPKDLTCQTFERRVPFEHVQIGVGAVGQGKLHFDRVAIWQRSWR